MKHNLILLAILAILFWCEYTGLIDPERVTFLYFHSCFTWAVYYFTRNPIVSLLIPCCSIFDDDLRQFITKIPSLRGVTIKQYSQIFFFLSVLFTPVVSLEVIRSNNSLKLIFLVCLLFWISLLSVMSFNAVSLPFGIFVGTIYRKLVHISDYASSNSKIVYNISRFLVILTSCFVLFKFSNNHLEGFQNMYGIIGRIYTRIYNSELVSDNSGQLEYNVHTVIEKSENFLRNRKYIGDSLNYPNSVILILLLLSRFIAANANDYDYDFYALALLSFLAPAYLDKDYPDPPFIIFKIYFWISYAVHCKSMNGTYFLVSFSIIMFVCAFQSIENQFSCFAQNQENFGSIRKSAK